MTLIYSPIADYRERLFRVIAAMERPEFDVYSDGPTTGHPTIGIGYDLTVPRSLESVLTAIGFDLGNAVDVAAMTQISLRIGARPSWHGAIDELMNGSMSDPMSGINDILVARSLNPSRGNPALPPRTSLQFAGINEIRYAYFGGGDPARPGVTWTGVLQARESALDAWLNRTTPGPGGLVPIAVPESWERMALMTLSYVGFVGGTQSPSLRRALQNEDRSRAWLEIRYNSLDNDPVRFAGYFKRNVYAAQLFGLYNDGVVDTNITLDDARSVYEALNGIANGTFLGRDMTFRELAFEVEQRYGNDSPATAANENQIANANADYGVAAIT